MKTIKSLTILFLLLVLSLSLIHLASAQLIYSTTLDNANNSGAHVPDLDMGHEVLSADPNQPIEFYITQDVSPATMVNATLDIFGNSIQFCGDTNIVRVNGNTVGSFASCIQQDYLFNLSPSQLVAGDNLVQIDITSIHVTHSAVVFNGTLIIFNSTIQPDSCVDTDGNNTATQGLVSGFTNGTQYSFSDSCFSSTGVTEFTCNAATPVATNISCGINGFTGSAFCLNGNASMNFTTYGCNTGACSSATATRMIQKCYYGCGNGACTPPSNPNGDDDSDGMSNGYEFNHTCLNPLVNDANIDSDNDSLIVRYLNNTIYQNISLTNIQEMNIGTDPCKNDTDADGFNDGLELYLGTNVSAKCSLTSTPNDELIDAWPADVNDDQKVSLADVLAFSPSFGSRIGNSTWNKRFDWNADGRISLADVLTVSPFFNKRCTQI